MLRLANRLLLPNGGGDWMANNMFLQRSLGKKSAVGGLFEAQQLGCAEDTLLSVLNRCLLGTESRNNFDSVAGKYRCIAHAAEMRVSSVRVTARDQGKRISS